MLPNLAYQLAVAIPALRPIYESSALNDSVGGGCDDVERAFNALLLEPLKQVEEELPASVVILIDALDECDGATAWANPVLKLLREHLYKLPNKVRFVITTRTEPHITSMLRRHFEPFEIKKDDPRHKADLKELITSKLQPLLVSSDELPPAVELLLERSEGTFVYIARALDSLEERENWTLAQLRDFLPVGMEGTFKSYFDKAWRQMKPEKQRDVADLLALLSAAFEPPCIRQLAEWLMLDPDVVKGTLKTCLGSLFIIKADERVNGFHKSIYDWLREPKERHPYQVNITPAHRQIGKALVATMVEHDSEM